ncbi:MAG: M20/M25/M40 family metallo-hydrolase [Bacteroidetes bacterium]|nr:M20/M25/M40 family metallo-hydrolase [Bacteroidota bacterium]
MLRFVVMWMCLPVFLLAQEKQDSLTIRKIYNYHLEESHSHQNLYDLCKNVGARLSGSPQAAKAVEWAKNAMQQAGADTVYLIPCQVPHWVRGSKEKGQLFYQGKKEDLSVCVLGGSVATPKQGLRAKVVEVHSFDELKQLGETHIRGAVVFFNVSFPPTYIHTGDAYAHTVKYRSGASLAAQYGAVATVTKSMTTATDDYPHTGVMHYYDTLTTKKIPAFAISAAGAATLSARLLQNKNAELFLFSDCATLPDEPSYSVVGELRGHEFPNEIMVVGGHLDSWDLPGSEGAHDDGVGIVQTIEQLRAFKKLNLKNKRTLRVIAFMNEENGTRGGEAYAQVAAQEKNKKHIAALESDMGGFTPRTIGVEAQGDTLLYYKKWQPLFEPYFVLIKKGYGGEDISRLVALGVPQFDFDPDSQRYFDFHHAANDTFEHVNKRELELGAATINAFIYLIDKYGAYKK